MDFSITISYILLCIFSSMQPPHIDHKDNIVVVKGCEGQCAFDICKSKGYYDVIVNPNNIYGLIDILNDKEVNSAFVTGWNDHCGDYVLYCNGAVTPFDVQTNNTNYALCAKEQIDCVPKPEPCVPKPQPCLPKPQPCAPKICKPVPVPVQPCAPRPVVKRILQKVCDVKPVKIVPVLKQIRKRICMPKPKPKPRRRRHRLVCKLVPGESESSSSSEKKVKPLKEVIPAVLPVVKELLHCPEVKKCNRAVTPVFPSKSRCVREEPKRCGSLNKEAIKKRVVKYLCKEADECQKPRRFSCEDILSYLMKILPYAYCHRHVLEHLLHSTSHLRRNEGISESGVVNLLEKIIPMLRSYVAGRVTNDNDSG